jgi:hypothetical protein
MPIGIVSDADLQAELDNYKPKSLVIPDAQLEKAISGVPSEQLDRSGPIIQDIPKRGRKDGDVNVPDSLRAIIGEEALLNGRSSAVALAAEFGISPSSASAYANGATSTATYDEPKPNIINQINKARQRATGRAAKTLNAALGSITQEKLDYLDADKISGIAKDMSVIIKNLEPKVAPVDPSTNRGPQFVIFAPQFRDERSYDVITVQE